MNFIINILDAMYHMLFFKTHYTNMPKYLAIWYGISGWMCVALMIWGFIKM